MLIIDYTYADLPDFLTLLYAVYAPEVEVQSTSEDED